VCTQGFSFCNFYLFRLRIKVYKEEKKESKIVSNYITSVLEQDTRRHAGNCSTTQDGGNGEEVQ
jgi:hypothetical protein